MDGISHALAEGRDCLGTRYGEKAGFDFGFGLHICFMLRIY